MLWQQSFLACNFHRVGLLHSKITFRYKSITKSLITVEIFKFYSKIYNSICPSTRHLARANRYFLIGAGGPPPLFCATSNSAEVLKLVVFVSLAKLSANTTIPLNLILYFEPATLYRIRLNGENLKPI